VISDCEGFEVELFSESAVRALRSSHCLIELHDFMGQDVSRILPDRFAPTHEVEIIEEGARNPNQYELLRKRRSLDRWIAMSEGRPETMRWMVARPRSARPVLDPERP
jgi:hypothetical protein